MNVNSFNSISEGTGQQETSAIDCCSVSVTDTTVPKTDTLTVVSKEDEIIETGTSVSAHWVSTGIILIFVLASVCIFYKQIKTLKDDIRRFKKMSKDQNNVINSQKIAIESLRNRLDILEQKAIKSTFTPAAFCTKSEEPRHISIDSTTSTTVKPIESQSITPSISTTVKYATLQAPDANGTLRFAERSMTDYASDQKMFEVELDTVNGTGTYRVNLSAMSMLMSDLQQLRDYVKPFATNDGSSSQCIINDKPGKIHKEGKFWIVDELAVIKLV